MLFLSDVRYWNYGDYTGPELRAIVIKGLFWKRLHHLEYTADGKNQGIVGGNMSVYLPGTFIYRRITYIIANWLKTKAELPPSIGIYILKYKYTCRYSGIPSLFWNGAYIWVLYKIYLYRTEPYIIQSIIIIVHSSLIISSPWPPPPRPTAQPPFPPATPSQPP